MPKAPDALQGYLGSRERTFTPEGEAARNEVQNRLQRIEDFKVETEEDSDYYQVSFKAAGHDIKFEWPKKKNTFWEIEGSPRAGYVDGALLSMDHLRSVLNHFGGGDSYFTSDMLQEKIREETEKNYHETQEGKSDQNQQAINEILAF